MARLVVAGTHSGVGKTTLSVGLMAAFARRGRHVQPYKAGPDYIDPTWHTAVTGVASRNLDLWLLSKPTIRRLAARPADLSIIEGMMGLYDGPGSTAELARMLKTPVVLVVDGAGMADSAAAIVRGFSTFMRGVNVAGVILNRISGDGHYQLLRRAIERRCRVRALGFLPNDDALHLPERHLGLVPAHERERVDALSARLVEHLERSVDLDGVLELAGSASPLPALKPAQSRPTSCRIAVARDEAFCFYYEDNLDLLRSYGAELVFFSPLHDRQLPAGVSAVYFGGGFPELFEDRLRAGPLADQLRELPIYAECGGLMYLAMVGLIPGRVTMHDRLQHFGYCEAEGAGSFLVRPGETIRGHEFHYSSWDGEGLSPAYAASRRHTGSQRPEGYASGQIHASYVHVHFHACPWLAQRFVQAAARFTGGLRDGLDARDGAGEGSLPDAAAVRGGRGDRHGLAASAIHQG